MIATGGNDGNANALAVSALHKLGVHAYATPGRNHSHTLTNDGGPNTVVALWPRSLSKEKLKVRVCKRASRRALMNALRPLYSIASPLHHAASAPAAHHHPQLLRPQQTILAAQSLAEETGLELTLRDQPRRINGDIPVLAWIKECGTCADVRAIAMNDP